MYLFKLWKDRVTEFTNRYRETVNADGTKTLEKVPGEITQVGTPQNAANFNNLESGTLENSLVLAEHTRALIVQQQRTADLAGEYIEFSMSRGNVKYPAPVQAGTVALLSRRNNCGYDVACRIVSVTLAGNGGTLQGDAAGVVGNVVITEKLLNGFKVAYTGSAQQVRVEFIITGGMGERNHLAYAEQGGRFYG